MSLILVAVLGASLARRYSLPAAVQIPTAFLAFGLSLPHPFPRTPVDTAVGIGATGVLLAIVIDLAVAGALLFAVRRYGRRNGSALAAAFVLTLATALWAQHLSLAVALTALLRPLGRLGDTLAGFIIITTIETALWTAGVHGPALLAGIVTPVYLSLQAQNEAAYAQGRVLPHIVTVSTFLFVFPGGAGATLSLVLLLLRSRVARFRKIALATLLPAVFNVNEPLMFGLPVVFNPTLAIPFILVPAVTAATTYFAFAENLVARPVHYVPTAVPVVISVLLATWDWRALVLVGANLLIGMALYAPFVRSYERAELRRAEAETVAAKIVLPELERGGSALPR
jgi:lactose/cellobiose-specific phosphotransferase system IIC component